jgi:endonuclease/exonuclease/phosphatase family metal-dependent hydrolase
MRKWLLLLTLYFILSISIYNFWILQRNDGMALTFAITKHLPKSSLDNTNTISIMTFNVAMRSRYFYQRWLFKGFFPYFVREHLNQVATIIREAKPDIVVLTEMAQQMLPFEERLVAYLADQSGMHSWVFNEDNDQVIVFVRYIGGNAILSRYPLQYSPPPPDGLPSPLATLNLPSGLIWVAGVHNDHKNWQVNLNQTKQILNVLNNHSTILAGDFNVPPDSPSIRLLETSNLFSGEFHSPPTSPISDNPSVTNDYIFAPPTWKLLEHRVIANKISDHKAVLSTFKINTSD